MWLDGTYSQHMYTNWNNFKLIQIDNQCASLDYQTTKWIQYTYNKQIRNYFICGSPKPINVVSTFIIIMLLSLLFICLCTIGIQKIFIKCDNKLNNKNRIFAQINEGIY